MAALPKLKPVPGLPETPGQRKLRVARIREAKRKKIEEETLDPRWPTEITTSYTNHAPVPPRPRWDWDDPISCELIRETWDDRYLYRGNDQWTEGEEGGDGDEN